MASMLFRKRSRRSEAQWRAEVSAQLAALMDAQGEMVRAATLQLEDLQRRRPGWWSWTHATLLLLLSGAAVFGGIVAGLVGTTEAANASSLQAQANNAISQSEKVTQPVLSLVKRKGEVWVLAHANKMEFSELESADHWAKMYRTDSTEASADQSAADRYQVAGPAELAFGSAVSGAILGWMLTQWLGLRWPKKRKAQEA